MTLDYGQSRKLGNIFSSLLVSIIMITPFVVTTNFITDTGYPHVTAKSSLVSSVQNNQSGIETGLSNSPLGIDINSETNVLYVFHNSDIISFINGSTYEVFKTVATGSGVWDLAVNPRTNMVYVTHPTDNMLSIINGSTNELVKTEVGEFPTSMDVNFDNNLVYVKVLGHIVIIDGETNLGIANVSAGSSFSDIQVNQNTNFVYSTDSESRSVIAMDGKTNRVTSNISLGMNPYYLAINPLTNMLYVSNQDGNRISVINCTSNKIVKTVLVGGHVGTDIFEISEILAINPRTNVVYVSHPTDNMLSVINGSINEVERSIAVGSFPTGIAVNYNTDRVYVVNGYSNDFNVIDGTMNTVLAGSVAVKPSGIKVGNRPVGIAVNPDTNMVYVANSLSDTVSVIDGRKDITVRNIDVGKWPVGVSVDPNTNTIFVTNFHSETASIIDGDTNQITANVSVGENPAGIAVNPRLHIVYVLNPKNNSISWFLPGHENNAAENMSLGPVNGNLSLVDLEDLSPYGISINSNPDMNIIYVTNELSNYVYAITHGEPDFKRIDVGGAPTGIAVNLNTNIVYVANRFGYISKIDAYSNSVLSNITIGNSPVGITINPNTNMLYISDQESNKIRVINGTTDAVIANITVGNSPVGITVNPNTNLIYVAEKDPESDLVHIVDGYTNKLLIGITFKVNPPNSGEIYCNDNGVSNYSRFIIGTVECEAETNPGFVFSSWSGSLALGSKNDPITSFTASDSGTLTANFIQPTPITIPAEFWVALYGVIPGFFIPSIIKWLNRKRQRRHLSKFLEAINDNSDLEKIKNQITTAYSEGKIDQADLELLKDKISESEKNRN